MDPLRPTYYITTAIPFVNARPHLGFALEIVLTDTHARYHRLKGEDVWFLTGTDENSLKNVQAAEKEGIPTAQLVERNSSSFRNLREALDLSFDDFIRTSSEERHLSGVRKLWEACDRSGDIYKKSYSGLYCVGCEQFYTPEELEDGRCPEHGTVPEEVSEENYFFRLSRYAADLERLIESDELRILPATRKNEVLSFIRRGLDDFSTSRSLARAKGWGVPVPGDPEQVMYVWFDALGNYITALDYAQEGERYRHFWTDNPERVHVIGKGITRFHAVYWPAMLLSAGVPLPTTIFVHGYVTIEGQKISKSLGNVIDPEALTRDHGADPVRYYLLRHVRSTDDGDFSQERFVRAHNADLADQLGNLLSRTFGMVNRYYGGTVPAPGQAEQADRRLLDVAEALPAKLDTAMSDYLTHDALSAIWELYDAANKYVVETQPWVLAKARKSTEGEPSTSAVDETAQLSEVRLGTVLYNLVEVLRLTAYLLSPFLPATAAAVADQLGTSLQDMGDWSAATRWGVYPAGNALKGGGVLFPKLELPEPTDEA